MGRHLLGLVGQRFGRLLVKSHIGKRNHSSLWICQCDCGTELEVTRTSLLNGNQKSCGCYRRDRMRTLTFKHAESSGERRYESRPEYRAWDGMKQRCMNPDDRSFFLYGGRGIRIHPAWANDFVAFLAYVGPCPSSDHSIDRYPNNDGNYEPGNVRWGNSEATRQK